ncbi:MAG: glycosyltransferase family 2 protein [Candidatus Pacearchaeota archaeon]
MIKNPKTNDFDISKMKIIAVIPAHNEEKYIKDVITQTKKYVNQVIVVDDASKDNTSQLAKQAGAIVLRHVVNLKKGSALKTGCEGAIMLGADAIILLDADGQHDPNEIPMIIEKLNKYELVIGAREFDKTMPIQAKAGNIFLSKLANFLFGSKVSDTQTGYRAFRTSIYPKIVWNSSDYGVETEMLKNIKKHNLAHTEVKVKTIYNDNYKGTTPLDGIKIALNMLQWRIKQ